jgi:hypothetical protein
MSRLLFAFAVALLPVAAFAQATGAPAAEKEVRAFIATYNTAYGRNDLDAYFQQVAEKASNLK